MKSTVLLAIILFLGLSGRAVGDTFGSGTDAFDIEFVTIGSPGNIADTTGAPNPAGSVQYKYQIAKFEISEQMITKANSLGKLGIIASGRGPNKPATFISWNEAARFVNWLNTSTGSPPAYKFAIQPGESGYGAISNIQLWTPSDAGYNPNNPFRNSLARYVLPSADEQYKAMYYDPVNGVYYDFPVGSNDPPDGIDFTGDPDFDAVFDEGLPGGENPEPNDITNVGLPSPFGVYGMGGNVLELSETEFDLINDSVSGRRIARGGTWGSNTNALWARFVISTLPDTSASGAGFRVVSLEVPEPSTIFVVISALAFLITRRRRKYS